jgi:hypothetical protein
MSETHLDLEEVVNTVPVTKLALATAVITPVITLVVSKKLRNKTLDFLFGPKEDFSIDPIVPKS